jgi:BCD family chlorophyll transporter-like MFS transporter
MMALASAGRPGTEGIRMGLWGGAQAIAFAVGGLLGTGAVDLARALLDTNVAAYAIVFAAEALVFLAAAQMAARAVGTPAPAAPQIARPRRARGAASPGRRLGTSVRSHA